MTLIVNLFAGPGAGKSTTAAGVFYKLKSLGKNVELVTEVAKDFTWANRHYCLRCQPLIFGKQLYRLERLIDKVDVVITDSPILLSIVYAGQYPKSFIDFATDVFNTFDNVNYLLNRKKEYVPIGRRQSAESSMALDVTIRALLEAMYIDYDVVDGNEEGVRQITHDIIERLDDNSGTSEEPHTTL